MMERTIIATTPNKQVKGLMNALTSLRGKISKRDLVFLNYEISRQMLSEYTDF